MRSPTLNALAQATLVALVSAGAVVLGLPVLALYRRIEKPQLLMTDARRMVYDHIARQPGATAADIALTAGFDRKTASHHARLLHLHSLLEAQRDGRAIRYFLPGHRGRQAPASGVAADILRLALVKPGLSQADAAVHLGVCRATVQWHVRRLAERGLLERGAFRVPAGEEDRLREALGAVSEWPTT